MLKRGRNNCKNNNNKFPKRQELTVSVLNLTIESTHKQVMNTFKTFNKCYKNNTSPNARMKHFINNIMKNTINSLYSNKNKQPITENKLIIIAKKYLKIQELLNTTLNQLKSVSNNNGIDIITGATIILNNIFNARNINKIYQIEINPKNAKFEMTASQLYNFYQMSSNSKNSNNKIT
uniref:Uncharacterized protein n=1 Tax=viral metagenome TaxID=1070528 RepID=A0A6C0F817_9ZZZZ|tara:strand:- start:6750 stop:7283 length:534 start_codon:yes stop_codon:yes gene_type:complete